jgi:MFS family permease
MPTRRRGGLPAVVWVAAAVWILAATAETFVLFTVLWLAAPQGWSGVQTAFVVLALSAPILAGGILGGRAVDHYGGRPIVLCDVGARTLLLVLLAVFAWNGSLPILAVLVIGAICGGLSPLSYTGVRWLMPRLVAPEDLPRANAAVAIGDQLPLLLAAVLVAPAIELLGPGRAMLLPAALLALATLGALRLPHHPGAARAAPPAPGDHVPPRQRPWRSRRIVALTLLSAAYYFAYGPFEPVVPGLVRDQLRAGAGTYVLLWGLFAVGALAALPLGPRLARRQHPGVVNALGAALWGLTMLPLLVITSPVIAAVVFLVGGAVWGPYSTVQTTALQQWSDPAVHGRVLGTQRALLLTAAPLGAALGAAALDVAAPATILAVSSGGCALAGLVALTLPALRR